MGTIFRVIVVASWLLYIVWYFRPDLWKPIDTDTVALLEWTGFNAIFAYRPLAIIEFWLWLFAAIGLFFFQNWGRYLFLFTCGYSIVLGLIGGVVVYLPIDMVLLSSMNMLDGAILALAFIAPLRTAFVSSGERRG